MDFFKLYPAIKAYSLPLEKKKLKEENDEYKPRNQAKNIETSFIMIVIMLLFGIFNLIFIYGTRNIEDNYVKVKYLKELFDNSKVSKI